MSKHGPEKIKDCAVMVNNGSGVLVPALSPDYSYVLTARHNLLQDPMRLDSVVDLSELDLRLRDGTQIPAIHIVMSAVVDAAIIQVSSQVVDPIAMSSIVHMEESMWLVGYPQMRRSKSDPVRLFPGSIESFDDDFSIEVSTRSFAPVDEVRGSSGGGVYTVVDNRWVLVAIEYEMEGNADEGHNWLRCLRISEFDKLIRENSLAPILPPFLLSFNSITAATFELSGFECKVTQQKLRTSLHQVPHTSLGREDCPTPRGLLEKFGTNLLVKDDPEWSLTDRKLWVSWLEYLILSILLDEPQMIDVDYIEALRKRRRFLYSGSESEWTDFIDKIIYSDLGNLEPGGLILISNRKEGPPAKTRSIKDISKIVADIALPVGQEFDIAIPRKPMERLRLLHLDGLHMDCVVRQEELYLNVSGEQGENVLQILTEAYRAALSQ